MFVPFESFIFTSPTMIFVNRAVRQKQFWVEICTEVRSGRNVDLMKKQDTFLKLMSQSLKHFFLNLESVETFYL